MTDNNDFDLKFTYGIVAQPFEEGDPLGKIKVQAPEKDPFSFGGIEHKEEDVFITAQDVWGHRSVSSIKTSNTVTASFFGGNSGISIPDVVNGEQILLVTYGQSGVYYWLPVKKDEHLRTNEHYRISCMSDPQRIKQPSDDNTYFMEINSKKGKKKIHFKTSKKDGEAYIYEFLVDAIKNTVEIKDDQGNMLFIDTAGKITRIINADGTKVEANAKNLLLYAPENIMLYGKVVSLNGEQLLTNFKTGIIGIAKMILRYVSKSRG